MADDETLRFYADNAATYAQHRTSPSGRRLDAFLATLPRGARVLELGCGNGMDAEYMLARGLDIDATDGTPELVTETRKRVGERARMMRFEELDATAAYDGVWASASLLHVPAATLPPHRMWATFRASSASCSLAHLPSTMPQMRAPMVAAAS